MRRGSMMVSLVVLLGSAAVLCACHTVAGAGQDVSSTGHAVTKAADSALH